jgi:hypothetical protein
MARWETDYHNRVFDKGMRKKSMPPPEEFARLDFNQTPEVAKPRDGALDDPPALIAAQPTPVLGRGANATPLVRADQLDAPSPQTAAQGITVVAFVGDHPLGLLPGSAAAPPGRDADGRQRHLREPDFRWGGPVKVVSQRKTLAVDHHHPLRPLAPLGFSDRSAPFLAGAKLPSRNASLQWSCWRSFNSPKNVRQICNQTPCCSQSRSRRQQVDGCGYRSGRSC